MARVETNLDSRYDGLAQRVSALEGRRDRSTDRRNS